ncbi:hypothetical protein [Pseudomonas oryzihabitans]|uniref:3-phosphoglycerate kinase n=1 Tax=Pseudomonas oryzihabitans TaxID=47885 RepID=A0A178L5T4_9PSED|nr:hypothetical protein [Pseudomonas oryzihabitans]OAN24859.1 hypothetical protein A4V15_07330 [Pseudomonas oryzihabitans]
MTRAAWLLAALLPLASGAAASARLEVQPQPAGAQVQLCFTGEDTPLSYELIIELHGPGGVARTRQAGEARGDGCPVTTRLSAAPGSLIDARLSWQRQGQPQPAIERRLQL